MKISRRNFLKSSAFAAVAASASTLLGCAEEETVTASSTPAPTTVPVATEEPEPTPEPTPEVPYYANVLTGFERDPDVQTTRITGVMMNNIAGSTYQNARPPRGVSSASIIFEIKVEGGITRFCALFSHLDDMPELGPIRSGRDQFLQMVMPYDGVYYHDGESYYCTLYVTTWDYSMYNFGGKTYVFDVETHSIVSHRDSRGGNVAYEHTEFTTGSEVLQAINYTSLEMEKEYEDTFFKFADYRTDEYNTLEEGEVVNGITIYHSDSYRTYFDYDATSNTYKMSQYSSASSGANSTGSNASTGLYKSLSSGGYVHTTVDELTGEQLGFTNVLNLFTTIEAYPGDSGDVQSVDYTYGGYGFYFTNGMGKMIYWIKGSPTAPLCILDPDLATISDCTINCGNTYVAIISLDEYERYSYGESNTIAAQ